MPWDMERTTQYVEFPHAIDWYYCLNGDPEYAYQMNRQHYLLSMAQAYHLSGEEKYARGCIDIWNDWMDRVPRDKGGAPWRTLEVGLRCEYWTKAMALLQGSQAVDEAFVAKYRHSLQDHIEVLQQGYVPHHTLSNWGVIQDHGLFAAALESGQTDLAVQTLHRMYRQAEMQLMADYVHWEQSCTYHNEVLLCFQDALLRARQHGVEVEESFVARVHAMARVNIAWCRPDRTQPPIGDSDDVSLQGVMTQSAYLFKDAQLKYLGYGVLDYDTVWTVGEQGAQAYAELQAQCPEQTAYALTDSGNYIARSDWSEKADYLMFRNGYTGGGHAHEDKLSMLYVCDGEDVLVDSGRYTYVWGKERAYFKGASAHNTASVDGRHALRSIGWGYTHLSPELRLPMRQEGDVVQMSGVHMGYAAHGHGVIVGREVLWLRPDVILVFDDFRARGLHRYRLHWNFVPQGRIQLKDNVCYFDGTHTRVGLYPIGSKLRSACGMYSKHYNCKCSCPKVVADRFAWGDAHLATAIVALRDRQVEQVRVQTVPLTYANNGRSVPDKVAQGLRIVIEQDVYTVIRTHRECMRVICAGELASAARCTVFCNGERIYVAW